MPIQLTIVSETLASALQFWCFLPSLLVKQIGISQIVTDCFVAQGYLMRNSPNVYLSSLALVAIPNIIGNYVGPLAFGLITAVRLKQKRGRRDDSTEEDVK